VSIGRLPFSVVEHGDAASSVLFNTLEIHVEHYTCELDRPLYGLDAC